MIEKGVKAPLTYNPGKGRPKEHLAYLNKGEMKALRLLNGNNMERGPEGLPSFPPADAKGSSSKASSTKSSSSVSRISGGTAGSNAAKAAATKTTARAPAASAAAAKASASKTSTASKGSSSVSRISGGTAGSNAARSALSGGGGARDSGQAANRSVSQSRSLTQSVAKPSATKTLNVGPMGTPVRVPSVRGPQIRSMPNIEPPTGPMPQGIKNLIGSASYLLDPNDPTLARRTIASTEPAPTFGEALSNLSMRDFTKGIYDLGIGGIKGAIDVAYDPYGSLKRGIGAIDNYVRDQFGNIISGSEAAMLGPGYGDPGAIGRGFESTLNIPLAGNLIGSAPANSLASLLGRRTSLKDLNFAMQYGKDELNRLLRTARPEEVPLIKREIFERTEKLTPYGVSGLHEILPGGKLGFEAYDPVEFKTEDALGRVRSGLLGKSINRSLYGEVMKPSLTTDAYPSLKGVPIGYNKSDFSQGYLGSYYPRGVPASEYYGGYIGGINALRDTLRPERSPVGRQAIEVNVPVSSGLLMRRGADPNEYKKILAHEASHYTSDIGGLYGGSGISAGSGLSGKEAFDLYRTSPGEITARKVQESINKTPEQIQNWDTRFGNLTSEEASDLQEGVRLRSLFNKRMLSGQTP